ncbi:hypothetical protein MMC08_001926 [Hypocenomyce scalaris]|nr:hypothetical protein [Hypocenomyce scalaris]
METLPPRTTTSQSAILIATLFAKTILLDAAGAAGPVLSRSNAIRTRPGISLDCQTAMAALLSSSSPPGTMIYRTTRALSAPDHPSVVELTFSALVDLSISTIRQKLRIQAFESTWNIEIVFQLIPALPRPPFKLAVFDMDSTLINQEVIDELARTIGIESAVSAITARAMNGELDFSESLKARVALLKGVRADVWEDLKGVITIADGARELCRALKKLGVKMAVLSGGFTPLAEWLKWQLGLDYAVANHLLTDPTTTPPTLSGLLSPTHPIIDATQKGLLLHSIAASNNIPLSSTMAVGDGANDLLMLHAAGLGVAFRAKERVQREAPNRLNSDSLVDILYLLGYTKSEIDELIS